MSFVDWQPSESMRSKVSEVADRRMPSRASAPTTASVVTTTSIVASAGASIPAPLAIPPTLHPSRTATACLLTVSVVMIAVAASDPPCGESTPAAAMTPASIRSMGSSSPMSPVEHTATSPAPTPMTSATISAVRWLSWKPCAPVQAFAPPELRTTASTRASART